MRRLLVILTLALTTALPAAAQHTWWVAAGAGRAFFGSTETAIGANAASGDPTATTHFGVPIEGQLFFRLGVIGLGLYGYANVNSDQSYGGLSAAIELGKLR